MLADTLLPVHACEVAHRPGFGLHVPNHQSPFHVLVDCAPSLEKCLSLFCAHVGLGPLDSAGGSMPVRLCEAPCTSSWSQGLVFLGARKPPISPLSCLLGPGAHAAGFSSFPVGRRGRWRCLMPVPRDFPSPGASPLFLCPVSPAAVGARAGLCSPGTLGPLEGISSTHSGDSEGVSHPHCLSGPGGWHLPQQESVLVMGFMTRQRPW